jgi:hypothetical protein
MRWWGGDSKSREHRFLLPLVAVRDLRDGGLDQLIEVRVPDAHGMRMDTSMSYSPFIYRLEV